MTSEILKKKSNETEIKAKRRSFSFVKMTLLMKPKLKRLLPAKKTIYFTLPTPLPPTKLRITKFTAPAKALKREPDFTKMPKKNLVNSGEYSVSGT